MTKARLALFLIFLLPLSCGLFHHGDIISDQGTVRYLTFEGGFYVIAADQGPNYEPTNLPPTLQRDGLRVFFRAKVRHDISSIHVGGEIIEILYITPLE